MEPTQDSVVTKVRTPFTVSLHDDSDRSAINYILKHCHSLFRFFGHLSLIVLLLISAIFFLKPYGSLSVFIALSLEFSTLFISLIIIQIPKWATAIERKFSEYTLGFSHRLEIHYPQQISSTSQMNTSLSTLNKYFNTSNTDVVSAPPNIARFRRSLSPNQMKQYVLPDWKYAQPTIQGSHSVLPIRQRYSNEDEMSYKKKFQPIKRNISNIQLKTFPSGIENQSKFPYNNTHLDYFSYFGKIDSNHTKNTSLRNRLKTVMAWLGGIAPEELQCEDGESDIALFFTKATPLAFKGLCQLFWNSIFVPLIYSHAAMLSFVIRLILWSSLWLWMTTKLFRDADQKTLFSWKFDEIPYWYWHVESAFLWSLTADYIMVYLVKRNKLSFFFSFGSIVDFISTPLIFFFTQLFSSRTVIINGVSRPFPWPLMLGFLRLLRLVKIESVFSIVFPWISEVMLKVLSIVLSVASIILTYAGSMFIFEAPVTSSNFLTVYDFFYYGIVTATTVGYGDFAPITFLGRTSTIATLIMTVAYLPGEVRRLMDAIRESNSIIGKISALGDNFICLLGPIEPAQLHSMCCEITGSFPGSSEGLLLLSPLPISSYLPLAEYLQHSRRLKICICGNYASLNYSPKYCQLIEKAKSVFVFCNARSFESSTSSQCQYNEIAENEEDQLTLLRFIHAFKVCPLYRPVSVQLITDNRKTLVTELGAYNIICLNEIKMKLMAKSCSDCPGFSTLVGNWFRCGRKMTRFGNSVELSDIGLYHHGASYQIYRMSFPACLNGAMYNDVAYILYQNYCAFLIGIISFDNKIGMNPKEYCIGEELKHGNILPFRGIILAPSLDCVVKISNMKEFTPAEPNFTRVRQRVQSQVKDIQKIKSISLQSELPKTNCVGNGTEKPGMTIGGIYEVNNFEEAEEQFLDTASKKLVLICGWPRGLQSFLMTLNSTEKYNAVILSPRLPVTLNSGQLLRYSHCCVYIKGSGLRANDLLRAGILRAHSVAIFSTSHSSWQGTVSSDKLDTQAILVRKIIEAFFKKKSVLDEANQICNNLNTDLIYRPSNLQPQKFPHRKIQSASVYDMTPQNFQEPTAFSSDKNPTSENGDQHVNNKSNQKELSIVQSQNDLYSKAVRTPTVDMVECDTDDEDCFSRTNLNMPFAISEIRQAGNLESPQQSWDAVYVSNSTKNFLADNFFEDSPDITSGKTYIDKMFYGLMAHTLPISKYAVDPSIIDYLVEDYPDNEQAIFHAFTLPQSCISMQQVPAMFDHSTFKRLFKYFLAIEGKLVLGIYRLREYQSQKNFTPTDPVSYVIGCPPPLAIVYSSDNVYVMSPTENVSIPLS